MTARSDYDAGLSVQAAAEGAEPDGLSWLLGLACLAFCAACMAAVLLWWRA